MQQVIDQKIEAGWEAKEDAAIKSGDHDAYREATVNRRVVQVLVTSRRESWSSWKTRSVCKYVGKTFQNMSLAELTMISEEAVGELVTHAALGFDDFARRRAAR